MVDYYDRQFAIAAGEPPSSLDRFHPYFEAQHQLSALVAEFTGEDSELVYQKACTGVLPVADKWKVDRPETPDEVRAFYGNTPQYFYDLVKWNSTPGFQRLLNRLAGITGARVLEFGGGIGTLAEYLAVRGNMVDYYDVPGVLLDFVRWRFARLPENLRPHIIERWKIGEYDWVTAVDVLEHLHPDEFAGTCNRLAWALKPGGRLFVHYNWKQENGMYPFHFDHSAAWAEFLERHKFKQLDDLIWQKPDDMAALHVFPRIDGKDRQRDEMANIPIGEF
jgi:2-polyprenyl-3-methyl-5-hydroxy-6-metoxy-1,4-benzoquinol methylase